MSEEIKIKTDDFLVVRDRWRIEVLCAIKVTSQLVFYVDKSWGDRTRRVRISDVLFAGDKATADKLAAQLTSSSALHDQECKASRDRKIKRDAEYISAAKQCA